MSTTARQILTLAYEDLNVIGEGEVLSAHLASTGLIRLNNLVSSLRAQYGTVTAVERTIFDLVANQQTYAIGPGAQFNVARPLTIDGAGLWLAALGSPQVVTSITRSGDIATVTLTSHGYAVGDEAYITGATASDYNGLQTVVSVPTANTFTYVVTGSLPATPATGTMTAQAVIGQPTEVPCPVITDDSYQRDQLKNLLNSQFTVVYYNPTYPTGTIVLWPRPSTNANALVLYLKNVFEGFADLDTVYSYADLPAYTEMLQYQMGQRLAQAMGRAVPDFVRTMAAQALMLVKRANNKLVDLQNDAALLTGDPRGRYNINSGAGG